jgi:hypothetical protein
MEFAIRGINTQLTLWGYPKKLRGSDLPRPSVAMCHRPDVGPSPLSFHFHFMLSSHVVISSRLVIPFCNPVL